VRRRELQAVSDHYPFFRAGVPILSFFTGRHDDYHQPTDTADRLDYDRMSRIAQLVADVLAGHSLRSAAREAAA
jgi:Zn-dependent M28 family amino/carboxypeptidase